MPFRSLPSFRRLSSQSALLYNSRSIHMLSVATVVEPGHKCWHAWRAATVSLLIVALQLVVLTIVLQESSHPSCSAHTDCPEGDYCSLNSSTSLYQHRCDDCRWILNDNNVNASACSAVHDDRQPWDLMDVDHTIWRSDGNFNATLYYECMAWQHCDDTDDYPDKCDHFELKMRRLSPATHLVLWLLALLMALPLTEDMDQAAYEEALLDCGMRDGGPSPGTIAAAQVLGLSLRLRQFWLPTMTSMAAVAVLVASKFSVIEIMLNLLAVAFITEADDMIAMAFLPPRAHRRADALVEKHGGSLFATTPWLEIRLRAAVCVGLVTTSPMYMRSAMEMADSASDSAPLCSEIVDALLLVFVIVASLFSIVMQPASIWLGFGGVPTQAKQQPLWCYALQQVWRGLCIELLFVMCIFFSGVTLSEEGAAFFAGGLVLLVACLAVDTLVRLRCSATAGTPVPLSTPPPVAIELEGCDPAIELLLEGPGPEPSVGSDDGSAAAAAVDPQASDDDSGQACAVRSDAEHECVRTAALEEEIKLMGMENTLMRAENQRVLERTAALEMEIKLIRMEIKLMGV